MFDTYLFVDAAYLRTNYLKRIRDWFDNDGEIDYYRVYTSQDLLSGRMFYYDCLDDKQHAGESHEGFQSRLEKQKSLLGKIKASCRHDEPRCTAEHKDGPLAFWRPRF
jgi:hypothetical protein